MRAGTCGTRAGLPNVNNTGTGNAFICVTYMRPCYQCPLRPGVPGIPNTSRTHQTCIHDQGACVHLQKCTHYNKKKCVHQQKRTHDQKNVCTTNQRPHRVIFETSRRRWWLAVHTCPSHTCPAHLTSRWGRGKDQANRPRWVPHHKGHQPRQECRRTRSGSPATRSRRWSWRRRMCGWRRLGCGWRWGQDQGKGQDRRGTLATSGDEKGERCPKMIFSFFLDLVHILMFVKMFWACLTQGNLAFWFTCSLFILIFMSCIIFTRPGKTQFISLTCRISAR